MIKVTLAWYIIPSSIRSARELFPNRWSSVSLTNESNSWKGKFLLNSGHTVGDAIASRMNSEEGHEGECSGEPEGGGGWTRVGPVGSGGCSSEGCFLLRDRIEDSVCSSSSSSETCISTGMTVGGSTSTVGTCSSSADKGVTLVLLFLMRRACIRSVAGISTRLAVQVD